MTSTSAPAAVDLYWIPLGAGGHVVRLSGKIFEATKASLEHRPQCALYHTALEVTSPTAGSSSSPRRSPITADETVAWSPRDRWDDLGRAAPAVSLRGPPMARRLHPRCERGCRKPGPRRERPCPCASRPRARSVCSHPRVGSRPAAHRRHVELQLIDLMAPGALRRRHQPPPAAARRPSTWVELGSRRRPTRGGGRGGIRTRERVAPLTVFKTVAFVRSATLPHAVLPSGGSSW